MGRRIAERWVGQIPAWRRGGGDSGYRVHMADVVIVGVDGSSGSAGAAGWALEEARSRNWSILYARVVPDAGVADPEVEAGYFRGAVRESEQIFRPLMEEAEATGVPAESQVLTGTASDVLIRLSARAGLVVVGRRHRSGYAARLGSVSAALAAHSSCCTAVIPETWVQGQAAGVADQASGGVDRFVGQVLAAVSSGQEAPPLLAVAAEMAARRGVRLCAVSVGEAGQDSLWLSDLLPRLRGKHPHLQCEAVLLVGAPADQIAEATRGARLLVMGTRGRSGIPGIVLGSVSQAVLKDAACPVVVVPPRLSAGKHP